MVNILDGNLDTLRSHEKKIRFAIKQFKLQRVLVTCEPITELPSNISTMQGFVNFIQGRVGRYYMSPPPPIR